MLFLSTNGTVKSSTKIASGTGGGLQLRNYSYFGRSLANLGEIDGDGVTELGVAANGRVSDAPEFLLAVP